MSIEVVTLNTSQMSTVVDRTLGSNSDRNEAAANDVLDIINISIEIVLPEVDMDLQHNTDLKNVYSSNEDVPDNVLDVSYMSVDITSQDNFQRSAFIDTTLGSNALLNTVV